MAQCSYGVVMLVLGIAVGPDLAAAWRCWLMPAVQPVVVPRLEAQRLGLSDDRAQLSFELWNLTDEDALVWLTRSQFAVLPQDLRRSQPAAHRWPRRDVDAETQQAIRYVESGRRTSRHEQVSAQQWLSADSVLPDARRLAGTFPDRSGPNCFATVMGAAGVARAEQQWMQLQPFEDWLAAAAVPGGSDDDVGTVLVWRAGDGTAAHAAVTLGSGWLLHKPSQGWMSPTKVLTVREGKSSARQAGRFLTRYRLNR